MCIRDSINSVGKCTLLLVWYSVKHFSTFINIINGVENVTFTCKFQDDFFANFISLQILLPAISFHCNLLFLQIWFYFFCKFHSLHIPHFVKIYNFPSIFLSLQIPLLAKWDDLSIIFSNYCNVSRFTTSVYFMTYVKLYTVRNLYKYL